MSIADAAAQVLISLQAIQQSLDPVTWADTPLPVIAAPQSFIDELAAAAPPHDPATSTYELHGCQVVFEPNATEPVMIAHDGKVYPVLPEWLRTGKVAGAPAEGGAA